MMSHRTLAVLIAIWAVITWGGRIGLLVGDESVTAKARIAVSLVAAVAAVAGLLSRGGLQRPAVGLYVATALAVWITSVISVLGDSASSTAFKGVHLVLAAVSITLAWYAWRLVFRRWEPEQAPRSEARSPTGR